MRQERNRTVSMMHFMSIALVILLSGQFLVADEIDDALGVEKMTDSDMAPRKFRVKQADHDPPALVLALQKKTEQLRQAKQEVARLKQWIVKIRVASRREKVVMHYNMGCVYKATKLYKKAEIAFLKALENNPRDPAVHYNLAILYDDDLNDKAKARKHYEKFLQLAPDDKDAPKVIEWLASLKPVPSGL